MDTSPLGGLPAEMRNNIFDHALAHDEPVYVCVNHRGDLQLRLPSQESVLTGLELALTCKHIYRETHLRYFAVNTFRLLLSLETPSLLAEFCHRLGPERTKALKSLEFRGMTMELHRGFSHAYVGNSNVLGRWQQVLWDLTPRTNVLAGIDVKLSITWLHDWQQSPAFEDDDALMQSDPEEEEDTQLGALYQAHMHKTFDLVLDLHDFRGSLRVAGAQLELVMERSSEQGSEDLQRLVYALQNLRSWLEKERLYELFEGSARVDTSASLQFGSSDHASDHTD